MKEGGVQNAKLLSKVKNTQALLLYTMEGRYCTFVPPLLLLHSCFRWKWHFFEQKTSLKIEKDS